MKCPYRKITETKHQYNADVTTEEFCECYGDECPFYTHDIIRDKDNCWKAREDGGMN